MARRNAYRMPENSYQRQLRRIAAVPIYPKWEDYPERVSRHQIAAYYNVTENTVRIWEVKGRLEPIYLAGGSSVRYDRDAVKIAIEQKERSRKV